MDDYSNSTSSNLDLSVLGCFERYRLPVVFSVIPFTPEKGSLAPQSDGDRPLSSAKADRLRPALRAGWLEIAQHGYSHRSLRLRPLRGDSEFAGLPPAAQRDTMMKGKRLLEERFALRITSFCPPFNRYDVNTVRELAASGFTTLSAGGYCHADASTALRYLPATCTIPQLPLAVDAARHDTDPQPVVVVLFHPYDFVEEDAARGQLHFSDLDTQLAWAARQGDVRVRTLAQANQDIRDLGASRYRAFFQCHALGRLLPEAMRSWVYPAEAYWTVQGSRLRALRLSAWLAAMVGTALLAALWFARTLAGRMVCAGLWCLIGALALVLAGGICVVVAPGFHCLLLMTTGSGFILGKWWPHRRPVSPRA